MSLTKDKEEKKIRREKKKQIKELEAHRDKLMEYDRAQSYGLSCIY